MNTNRREFLKKAALGTSGLLILSSSRTAFTYEANSKMNLAVVGLEYGRFHLERISESNQNLVAICDINLKKMDDVADRTQGARRFQDFRQMIEEMGDQLDGIFIATPHHSLTTIAAEAMKAGKHVYCEKPLSHDIGEARFIRQLARKHKGRCLLPAEYPLAFF